MNQSQHSDDFKKTIEKYQVILADPPWAFEEIDGFPQTRIQRHYPMLTPVEIAALPVERMAADNATLFMWTTGPKLFESFGVLKAWGFQYKTIAFTWAKLNKKSEGFFFGMGNYTRANAELCLLATRGKPLPRKSMSIRQLVISPRREHSRKPDEIYDRIEALYDGPYLELFSRGSRQGWTHWGNEVRRYCKEGSFLYPMSQYTELTSTGETTTMAAQSVMEQIRKLDEQRNALMEGAKKEAMDKAQAALADLNSLGFHYRLVEGTERKASSGDGRKGTRQRDPDKVCPICEFKTEPPHDARRHRGQKVKQPFTTAELEMLHLKRVE